MDEDLRGLTEDAIADLLFDQAGALALAEELRLGTGGDTVSDRRPGDAPPVADDHLLTPDDQVLPVVPAPDSLAVAG